MAQEEKVDEAIKLRQLQYSFGKRSVNSVRPSKVPSKEEAAKKPNEKLKLEYAYGYQGNNKFARNNLHLSKDGKQLIYYTASVGVVHDIASNTQKFFCGHNDDIQCITVDPRENSNLVATGQKDPKDRPGQGKETAKICVWDSKTMKQTQVLNNVSWGKVAKLQWSSNGMLYMLGGDPDQTLKGWNSKNFKKALVEMTTMKGEIFGFKCNSNPGAFDENVKNGIIDELVFYGASKYSYIGLTKTSKFDEDCPLKGTFKAVPTSKMKRGIEKAFVCCDFIPSHGVYAVGASSGAVYLNKGLTCLSVIDAHSKAVADMIYDSKQDLLITIGFDKLIKKFLCKQPKNDKKPKILVEKYKSGEVSVSKTSDFVLKAKAIAYNNDNGELFIGCKSNQIIKASGLNKKKKKDDDADNKDDEKAPGPEKATLLVDGHEADTWAVCAHPKEPYFATGGYDGRIKIWNSNDRTCVYSLECLKKQFNCGTWSPSGSCIVMATEGSEFLVFRWDNAKKTAIFESELKIQPKRRNAAVEPVSCVRFNNGSSLLAVAHMDGNVYIYNVKNDAKSGKYSLKKWKDVLSHTGGAPVDVQWSTDSNVLKTFTRDYEICHWKLNLNTQKTEYLPQIPDPDKVEFFGDPLLAGWDVQGLFQKGWDGTDLNNVSLSKSKKLIVSGDDFGIVRLHNYPAIDPAACHEYSGHAEFVVGVQFLNDDKHVASCGGADMTVFQWKVC